MKHPTNHHERAKLRGQRSPQYYLDFVAKHPQSGLAVSQYCRKHQVGVESFRKYRRILNSGKTRQPHHPKKILPRLIPIPSPASLEPSYPIEVALPSGARIRLTALNDSLLASLRPWLDGVS